MKNPFEKRQDVPKESQEDLTRRKFGETAGVIFGGAGVEKPVMPPEEIAQLTESAQALAKEEQEITDNWSSTGDVLKDALFARRHGKFVDYETGLREALAASDESKAKINLTLMELTLDDLRKAVAQA